MAQWSSSGGLALPGLDEWALGFESQRVGAHFFSLGNLALPGDLAFEHVYTRISTHGLQLSADEARYHSDLDDDPLRAKRHGHTRGVAADYTPLAIDPTRGVWRVFGMPTLSAEWKDVTWRQRPEDAPLVGFDVNSRSRTHSFGIDFSRDIFTLSLHRDATRFDDETQTILVDDFEIYTPSPDTRELAYSVQLGWTPSQRLTIAPQVQLTRLREVESGARSRSVLWGLQAQAVLMPARLWLRTSFSETRDRMELSAFTDSTQSLTSGGGTAALVYRARGARDLSPALDLRLTGHYARGFTHDTWQAMFGFAVNWQRAAQ